MAVDWTATGAWMQAWAGFAQAGAVVFVAYKGADAFKAWRRQKIEERRMQAAERILTVAYRMRRALSAIRHPMMWSGPLEAAEQKLLDKGYSFAGMSDGEKKKVVHAQAILDRIGGFSTEWDEMLEVTPLAKALFGAALESQLERLMRQRNMVAASAESYADDDGSDPAFTKQIRADIWENLGTRNKSDDKIAAEIAEAISSVEAVLLPILRTENP